MCASKDHMSMRTNKLYAFFRYARRGESLAVENSVTIKMHPEGFQTSRLSRDLRLSSLRFGPPQQHHHRRQVRRRIAVLTERQAA
jgi:hypothetical protein